MFGNRRRREHKLRERGGRTAMATIVEAREHTITRTKNLSSLPDRYWTRMRLIVRVEPPGEPAFKAKLIDYSANGADLTKDYSVAVIYDPDDHSKIARDRSPEGEARTYAAGMHKSREILRRNQERLGVRPRADGQGVSGRFDELVKLADLRESGALTDAEFKEHKAKLLGHD